MSERVEMDGTIRFRVSQLEQEAERQRQRSHDITTEQASLRLMIQRNTDEISHLSDDVGALKRAFYTFAVGVVGSAVVFAFTVFALLGHHS